MERVSHGHSRLEVPICTTYGRPSPKGRQGVALDAVTCGLQVQTRIDISRELKALVWGEDGWREFWGLLAPCVPHCLLYTLESADFFMMVKEATKASEVRR